MADNMRSLEEYHDPMHRRMLARVKEQHHMTDALELAREVIRVDQIVGGPGTLTREVILARALLAAREEAIDIVTKWAANEHKGDIDILSLVLALRQKETA